MKCKQVEIPLTDKKHPFDADAILDGIRSWVEIESPTEAPEQINKLATVVADGYRGLPATIERVPGKDGRGEDRFTSREMIETERRLEQAADRLALQAGHGYSVGRPGDLAWGNTPMATCAL